MFKRLLGTVLAASFLFAGAAQADTYNSDPAHTYVLFKVTHMGIAPNFGQFLKHNATIEWDAANPKFNFEIETGSVFTGNQKRDKHLRNADFFNAKQFPKVTFKSTKAEKAGDAWKITGDLTMNGKTKSVTTTVTKTGEGNDPWGNYRLGLYTEFKVKRSDFGMTYGIDNGAVADEVTLMVSVEGIKKK